MKTYAGGNEMGADFSGNPLPFLKEMTKGSRCFEAYAFSLHLSPSLIQPFSSAISSLLSLSEISPNR